MASGLITSWQIEGEKVDAMTDFLCHKEAWHSAAHGAVQSQTPLGDWTATAMPCWCGAAWKVYFSKLLNIDWGYVSSFFMGHSLLMEKGLA